LDIGETPVTDLTPLKNLSLTRLIFSPKNITTGLEPIRRMKSLTEVGVTLQTRMAPQKFWQLYDQGKLQ
jgi:Leucine-rich repeat (LRR) protein